MQPRTSQTVLTVGDTLEHVTTCTETLNTLDVLNLKQQLHSDDPLGSLPALYNSMVKHRVKRLSLTGASMLKRYVCVHATASTSTKKHL